MKSSSVEDFRKKVWNFYSENKRELPWRSNTDPYWVLVSEIMLQQMQVSRVLIKFAQFIERFPDLVSLAKASLPEVLTMWQGLGYNRRGKFLHHSAQAIMSDFGGVVPQLPQDLEKLPGIGKNTAGSIAAFAYNYPSVFIETNIRRIFLHEFLADQLEVPDSQIFPLISETLDSANPREWYWALMDYGNYLAKILPNPNRRSKHFVKQSKFEGSNRQVRAKILRILLEKEALNYEQIRSFFDPVEDRILVNLEAMVKEGLLEKNAELYRVSGGQFSA